MGMLEILLLIALPVILFTSIRAQTLGFLLVPIALLLLTAVLLAQLADAPLILYGTLVACLTGLIAAKIAQTKGRSIGGWFLVGLLLNLLGIILIAVMDSVEENVEQQALSSGGRKKCPYCAELVKVEAVKCRYCGGALASSPGDPR